ncbi:MAG: DUF6787 family protein [Flavobacteriaceae bacterium]
MYFNRLKEKWGITSNLQLVIVFVVFGLTGSFSVRLAEPFLELIGLTHQTFNDLPLSTFLYWILRIIIIFPLYQILLIFFGTLFFQFRFFWDFEKKILKRMGFKRFFKEE